MKKDAFTYKLLFIILAVFLVFTVSGCSLVASAFELKDKLIGEDIKDNTKNTTPVLKERRESNIEILAAFNQAISNVAEEVKPSVVNIRVMTKHEDFFGHIREREGVGSGVVFSSDGYIITNNHVTESSDLITVTLSDGSEYQAKLIGADKDTDISVIKIETDSLKPGEFTTIEEVKVGEIAIALGSPFGLQASVTQGVISAIGRDLSISYDSMPMVDLLQTDAAINPGNSGGPLVNSTGQVMGINTIIFSTSGSSSGIGFAIPSDTAVNIAEQIIKYGEARIPFIGIEMGADNDTDIKGVFVSSIVPDSAAEEAGLKANDIITEFNGKEIKTPYQLIAQMQRHDVGDKAILKIYRNGDFLDIKIILKEK
ncbi:MAG: trypsin-like peptidase domain-containing protein [Actinomycetota bacterium]|nr:trypsin-like peptidase domain-containing protein [Actinomycetota bacterium]